MIPKIVHYSWFSGDPMPESYISIMENWKKVLPDYELRLWDAKALKEANLTFANEAFAARKWAFAADAIRCYAVYHEGGIWLDGDVVVHQSFDPFLCHRMFIGKEYVIEFQHDEKNHNVSTLTSHCFGAEKEHPFLKDCVNYYKHKHFIQLDDENMPQGLRYDMRLIPSIQSRLALKYGYQGRIPNLEDIEVLDEDIHVYPPYYFDEPRYHGMKDVVCIHCKAGSWRKTNTWNSDIEHKIFVRKKDLFYYIYTWANKYIAKKGYWLKVISI